MEADWSVELAAECPRIVVPWREADGSLLRYIDLRADLHGGLRAGLLGHRRGRLAAIEQIEEARRSPPLRAALLALNAPGSALETAKCDAWETCGEELDRFELDAPQAETACSAGSYIDLLLREPASFASFAFHQRWLRATTARLRESPLRAARMDFLLRHAERRRQPGFAVSWFVQGCGVTLEQARTRWAAALALGLAALAQG